MFQLRQLAFGRLVALVVAELTIAPSVDVCQIPDRPVPDQFADAVEVGQLVTLRPDLGAKLVLLGQVLGAGQTGLRYGIAQRLLHIAVKITV
jgi:hypothetical protein